MISGGNTDIVDSEESVDSSSMKSEMNDFPNSQESFSDIWETQFDMKTDLFPELNLCSVEEIKEYETQVLQSLTQPSTSTDRVSKCMTLPSQHFNDSQVNKILPTHNSILSDQNIGKNKIKDNIFCKFSKHHELVFDFTNFHEKSAKSTKFSYSTKLNKMFVQMNEICPFQLLFKNCPPPDSCIKIIPYFKNAKNSLEVVKPCLLHQKSSSGNITSFVQAPNQNATNVLTSDGRQVVCIPLNDSNMKFVTVLLKFTCLSSCKSGINKRPVALVFFLETSNRKLLGHCSVDICICTRPDRDCENHEKKLEMKSTKKLLKRPHPFIPDSLFSDETDETDDDQIYFMAIRGKKTYERLLAIKQAFDLEKLVSADDKKKYFKKEAAAGNT